MKMTGVRLTISLLLNIPHARIIKYSSSAVPNRTLILENAVHDRREWNRVGRRVEVVADGWVL